MRRNLIIISALAIVLVGLLAAVGGSTTAQDDTSDGPDLAGSWLVVVSRADGVQFPTLSTYSSEGTVVSVGSPAQAPPPNSPPGTVFFSVALGSWEATGADTANATFIHLRANAEGAPLGTTTVRLAITMGADGQAFTGQAEATMADPAGTVLATFSSTVQGTRIAAEAPGTPSAATPTA